MEYAAVSEIRCNKSGTYAGKIKAASVSYRFSGQVPLFFLGLAQFQSFGGQLSQQHFHSCGSKNCEANYRWFHVFLSESIQMR